VDVAVNDFHDASSYPVLAASRSAANATRLGASSLTTVE
jgi:hypothetical protein